MSGSSDLEPTPPTRWAQSGPSHESGYVVSFTRLLDEGADVDGEARLADALAPRGARVLDAGAGLGRVSDGLQRRGHDVTAIEPDSDLVDLSRRRFPQVPVLGVDLLAATPELLAAHGRPPAYDVVVLVGNVMVFLAEDTEVRALVRVGDLLAPEGRVLVGFHPVEGPPGSRDYPWESFAAHVEDAGLVVLHRFGTYGLGPPAEDYVVAVLAADG